MAARLANHVRNSRLQKSQSAPNFTAASKTAINIEIQGVQLSPGGCKSKPKAAAKRSAARARRPPRDWSWFDDTRDDSRLSQDRSFKLGVSETKAAYSDLSAHLDAAAAVPTIYSKLKEREAERMLAATESASHEQVSGFVERISESKTHFRRFTPEEMANARMISPQIEEIQRFKDRREKLLQKRAAAFAAAHGVANPLQHVLAGRDSTDRARPTSAPLVRCRNSSANIGMTVPITQGTAQQPAVSSTDGREPQRKSLSLKDLIKQDISAASRSRPKSASSKCSDTCSAISEVASIASTVSSLKRQVEASNRSDASKEEQTRMASVEEEKTATLEEKKPSKPSIVPELKAMIMEYKQKLIDAGEDDTDSACSTAATARSAVSEARSAVSTSARSVASAASTASSRASVRKQQRTTSKPAEAIARSASLSRLENLQKQCALAPRKSLGVGDLMKGGPPHPGQQSMSKFQYSWIETSNAAPGRTADKAATPPATRRPSSAGPARGADAPRGAAYKHCKATPEKCVDQSA